MALLDFLAARHRPITDVQAQRLLGSVCGHSAVEFIRALENSTPPGTHNHGKENIP